MLMPSLAHPVRQVVMALAVSLLVIGLSSLGERQMSHAATEQEPSKAQLQQRMQTLQTDIRKLQNWLQQAQQKASRLNQQLATSERQISTLNKHIRERRGTLTSLRNKLQVLQGQASQLQDSLFEQETLLAAHLRQQYQLQQRQSSGLLFSLTDATDASRMMAYFRYLHEAQAEQLTAYRHSLDRLNQVQQQQADAELALQQELHQLDQQESQLVTARGQQKVASAQLQQERQSKHRQLADSNAAKQQIEDLLEQLEIALKKAQINSLGQPFAKRKSQLSWPLRGKVLNRFGQQQLQYPLSENGWLIKAKVGSSVLAVHTGQVVFANWLKGYGLLLIIDHGNGYLTLYGQNQSLYKEVGDKVAAGELIANSGKTGGQQISALYFSIRKDGQPQNPQHWLMR